MKIVTIIGARPQFIKAAAVSRAIAVQNFTPPKAHPPLYGDGQAAEKIVHVIQRPSGG